MQTLSKTTQKAILNYKIIFILKTVLHILDYFCANFQIPFRFSIPLPYSQAEILNLLICQKDVRPLQQSERTSVFLAGRENHEKNSSNLGTPLLHMITSEAYLAPHWFGLLLAYP